MSHRGPRGARPRVPAGTAKHRAFPFEVARATLANGLEVFTIPTDAPGIAAHYLVVRTGSRNEVEPGLSGFAHLFEHMMFRGTDRFSAERYNDVLKRLGADSNAFTSDDWTCYHVTAASPAIDRGAGFSNLAAIAPAIQTPNGSSILAPCSGTFAQAFPADYDSQFRPQLRSFRVRTRGCSSRRRASWCS